MDNDQIQAQMKEVIRWRGNLDRDTAAFGNALSAHTAAQTELDEARGEAAAAEAAMWMRRAKHDASQSGFIASVTALKLMMGNPLDELESIAPVGAFLSDSEIITRRVIAEGKDMNNDHLAEAQRLADKHNAQSEAMTPPAMDFATALAKAKATGVAQIAKVPMWDGGEPAGVAEYEVFPDGEARMKGH